MMKHPSAGVKRELVADQSILNPHCKRGAHTLGHYLTMRPARSQLLPLRSSLRGRESTVVVPPLSEERCEPVRRIYRPISHYRSSASASTVVALARRSLRALEARPRWLP